MPAQREVDEAAISRQVEKIAEGIRTKDLEGLWHLYPPALSVEIGAERFVLVVLEFASQRL
jgi:hypothetical protein